MKSMKTEWVGPLSDKTFISLVLRVFLYAVLLGGLAYGMLWGAIHYGAAFYDEIGPVEVLESIFTLSTALIFLFAARVDSTRESCVILLTGVLFCIFIRESDYFLDVLVAPHVWKVLVSLMLVFMAGYVATHLNRVVVSVSDFTHHSSFGIFLSGLLVVIVFSRLFGHGEFWKELLHRGQYRIVKTIVEEGVELMGYFLLLIASCEYLHDAKIQRLMGCHPRFSQETDS